MINKARVLSALALIGVLFPIGQARAANCDAVGLISVYGLNNQGQGIFTCANNALIDQYGDLDLAGAGYLATDTATQRNAGSGAFRILPQDSTNSYGTDSLLVTSSVNPSSGFTTVMEFHQDHEVDVNIAGRQALQILSTGDGAPAEASFSGNVSAASFSINSTQITMPPVCMGTNKALQYDGVNWHCVTVQ